MFSEPGTPRDGVCAPRSGLEAGFPEGDPHDAEFQQALASVMMTHEDACQKAAPNKSGARIVFCDSSSECGGNERCCSSGIGPTGGELPEHCTDNCAGKERCASGDTCRTAGTTCRGGVCMSTATVDCAGVSCGGDKVCCNSFKTGKATCMEYAACAAEEPGAAPRIEECDSRKTCKGAFCVAMNGRSSCATPPINLQMSELRCATDDECTYEGPISAMNDPGCKSGKCVPSGNGMKLCECQD